MSREINVEGLSFITVTDAAKNHLEETVGTNREGEKRAIRVCKKINEDGFVAIIDNLINGFKPGDKTAKAKGFTFIIEQDVREMIYDFVVEYTPEKGIHILW